MRAALLLAALAVAGCSGIATVPAPGDSAAWEARRAALAALTSWRLEGRAAIAAGDDGYSGSLSWAQDGESLDFSFEGPLGSGGLRIRGDAAAFEVSTSKGERYTVVDPETELSERLGWPLPLRSMRHWVVGIPDPASAFDADYDAAGRPRRIEQRGWTVRYDGWRDAAAYALPRKLTIERDDLRIKLVSERWILPAAAGG